MIVLKILRFILPPCHPLKYRWISYWFDEQSNDGGWKDKKVISNKIKK